MTPRDEVAAWADGAALPTESLESALLRRLAGVPQIASPGSMFRIVDGDALEVLEQIENALQALRARGVTDTSQVRVRFEEGACYLHG